MGRGGIVSGNEFRGRLRVANPGKVKGEKRMSSQHSRARSARQRLYRIERRRVMREALKKAEEAKAAPATKA